MLVSHQSRISAQESAKREYCFLEPSYHVYIRSSLELNKIYCCHESIHL